MTTGSGWGRSSWSRWAPLQAALLLTRRLAANPSLTPWVPQRGRHLVTFVVQAGDTFRGAFAGRLRFDARYGAATLGPLKRRRPPRKDRLDSRDWSWRHRGWVRRSANEAFGVLGLLLIVCPAALIGFAVVTLLAANTWALSIAGALAVAWVLRAVRHLSAVTGGFARPLFRKAPQLQPGYYRLLRNVATVNDARSPSQHRPSVPRLKPLLEPVLVSADTENVNLYLHTYTDDARLAFARLGFVEVTPTQKSWGIERHLMVRVPGRGAGPCSGGARMQPPRWDRPAPTSQSHDTS